MNRLFVLISILALAACSEKAESTGGAAVAPGAKTASAPATPEERGRRQFNECAVCHTAKQGEGNRVGPNLFGVAGGEAAQVEGFAYSKAMTESGLVWTDENLDAFIENPPAFLRGTRMAYAGQRDAEKRADLIAYLKTLK
ncbi:c-type cytochrome [Hyphococcus sp.]|uniref:c-type cytochrome n=1 Tax=Hyphococcus sp. TaxID=2038636 RepID=UPI00208C7960|nr:MAG: cytochrome c [Marinicaulis sp.]